MVTGANSGIGLATATALAGHGANVTITARSEPKALAALDSIEAVTGVRAEFAILDLADTESIEECALALTGSVPELSVLVNNAGAIFGSRRETGNGWELTLATNHLGPFLLTHRLLPLMRASGQARVINVASSGHGYAKDGFRFADPHATARYRMMGAYGQSKLANILHAAELDRRYADDGIHAYSMHPGLVSTSIGRGGDAWLADLAWRVTKRRQIGPDDGADTAVWLATAEDPRPYGGYFEHREEARSTRHARDDAQARELWDWSASVVGIESTP